MSYEMIALLMFGSMLVLLVSGQRVFAAIGAVAMTAALLLYGDGAIELSFNQVFKLFNWYAMLTLPMFIYMGYILAEAGIAEDLYKKMHVWFGRLSGGLAIGTILVMVIISAMNGLSVAGMAIVAIAISLDRISQLAQLGIDVISVGKLTHSAPARMPMLVIDVTSSNRVWPLGTVVFGAVLPVWPRPTITGTATTATPTR